MQAADVRDNGSSLTREQGHSETPSSSIFEGDSSLRTQLARLSGLMGSIVKPGLLADESNPHAEKMLASLNRLATMYESDSVAHDMDLPHAKLGCGDAQMPPLESILIVLRWSRGKTTAMIIRPKA